MKVQVSKIIGAYYIIEYLYNNEWVIYRNRLYHSRYTASDAISKMNILKDYEYRISNIHKLDDIDIREYKINQLLEKDNCKILQFNKNTNKLIKGCIDIDSLERLSFKQVQQSYIYENINENIHYKKTNYKELKKGDFKFYILIDDIILKHGRVTLNKGSLIVKDKGLYNTFYIDKSLMKSLHLYSFTNAYDNLREVDIKSISRFHPHLKKDIKKLFKIEK